MSIDGAAQMLEGLEAELVAIEREIVWMKFQGICRGSVERMEEALRRAKPLLDKLPEALGEI